MAMSGSLHGTRASTHISTPATTTKGMRYPRGCLRMRGPMRLQAAAGESIREEASHRGRSLTALMVLYLIVISHVSILQSHLLGVIRLVPNTSHLKMFEAKRLLRRSIVWIR